MRGIIVFNSCKPTIVSLFYSILQLENDVESTMKNPRIINRSEFLDVVETLNLRSSKS
jgi:hypothetical protein